MNTNRWGLFALALTIIALCGVVVLVVVPPPKTPIDTAGDKTPATSTPQTTATTTSPAGISDLITVAAPLPMASVGSTSLTASGLARGTWYFEASFPVELKNASGVTLLQAPAQAQSDWMTEDFVPFKITLTYPAQPKGSHGTLILHNDNPSGDPARDKKVEIAVVFN